MNAQPECDIDSTPAANPTLIAPTWMACAREIAALSEEAQKRFIVIAGTLSGNPAASAANSRHISHAFVAGVHASRSDVVDAIESNPGAVARGNHRQAQQIVEA